MSDLRIVARGELGHRLSLSNLRMEGKEYLPDYIWSADKNCWPGDWEGRTILALVSLAKATCKEPAYLEEIMDLLESNLNSKGYMGEIENNLFSEQQLAGNSWLLRGIIEYTEWKKTDKFISIIKRIIENLYLPMINAVDEYPLKKINKDGDYSGSIIAVYKSWKMSTDIGCMYISLDGITQAYEFLRDPRLLPLIDKMIKRFGETDNLSQGFQTHATLSCLRGVIRAYQITKKDDYLHLAIKRFDDYLQVGMTENYENNHLFYSHKWTEPCGIVDSYICSVELFKLTGKSEYLDIAQKIYFNGICRVQLPNGGFGLDKCLGYNPVDSLEFNKTSDGKPVEAYWCCTMRGADGLSYIHQNQCIKSNKKYQFINYFDSTIYDEDLEIRLKTKYPFEGKISFNVNNPFGKQIELCLYLPEFAGNVILKKNGDNIEPIVENGFAIVKLSEKQTEITLEFDITIHKVEPFTADNKEKYFNLWHGNLILGTTNEISTVNTENLVYMGEGKYLSKEGAYTLAPICNTYKKSDETVNETLKLMFLK